MTLLLALALLALPAPLQQTPAPPDTTEIPTDAPPDDEGGDLDVILDDEVRYDDSGEDRPGIQFRPRVAPSALYSSSRGFGIGGGVGIRNAGWAGTDLTLDLRLQQRFQSANATFFTGDPFDDPFHSLVSVGGSTTERRRYYGLGPTTLTDNELNLIHDAAEAEVRAGWYPFGSTILLVQPGVRYLYDRHGGVNDEASSGSLDALDAPSRAAVPDAGERRYGLSAGLELAADLRDWAPYPQAGSFGTIEARRFVAFDDSDLSFNRYSGSYIVYLPIEGRTTVILRGVGALTRSDDGDGDGLSDAIPYFYLPTLDDRVAVAFKQERLTGRDIVAFGAGLRVPVVDLLGVYGIDALLMGYIGNAYDDVFEQFKPAISFSEEAVADAEGRAALRPALGLGLGIINLDKERVVVGGLLGVGPGGITVATLRIAYDLRDARPLFR